MHSNWKELLEPESDLIDELLERLSSEDFLPHRDHIFRALSLPISEIKVIILGQDPYPTPGMAEGLAFSVPPSIKKLPPSLRNILREYSSDLQLPMPHTGHLGNWVNSGVLLLNRILTVKPHVPLSHQGMGWEQVTDQILTHLSQSAIPVICWGAHAHKAAIDNGFNEREIFASPHPSPLSAHRGFFGSQPFSKVNKYLEETGREPINWRLE